MTQFLRGSGYGDKDLLSVLMPSSADRATRQAHCEDGKSRLPSVEEWRLMPVAGRELSEASGQVVRSNHFLVNTSSIPPQLFQYHVHLYPIDNQTKEARNEDIASKEDFRINVALMAQFRQNHDEFSKIGGQRVGFVYDSRNCVITTHELPLPDRNSDDEPPYLRDEVCLVNSDGTKSNRRFILQMTYSGTVILPQDSRQTWATNSDASVIRALDLSLLGFAREQLKDEIPSWYLVGNKCFSERASKLQVADGYVALRGYTVGLRSCLAGLTLVSDMTVSVFLNGGPVLNVVGQACGFDDIHRFLKEIERYGIHERDIPKINKVLKNCKIHVDHLVGDIA